MNSPNEITAVPRKICERAVCRPRSIASAYYPHHMTFSYTLCITVSTRFLSQSHSYFDKIHPTDSKHSVFAYILL